MRSYPKPRRCTVPTLWHGYYLQKGDIFGQDQLGYYVTTNERTQGVMIFKRPNPNREGVLSCQWLEVITLQEDSCAVAMIGKLFGFVGHRSAPITFVRHVNGKAKIVTDEVIRDDRPDLRYHKCGSRYGRKARMAQEYLEMSRAVYGDVVEMNGKQHELSPKYVNYMDGFWK